MSGMRVLSAAALCVAATIGVSAQARVPDRGMWGLSLEAGVAMPFDDALASGINLGAALEGYVTPRVSIRGQVAGPWFDIKGRPFEGSIRPMAFTVTICSVG